MKFNWKVLVGIVVLIAVGYWGVDSLRTRSYSGTDLNFSVGGGTLTVTNPSDVPVPAQFVGVGTRSFSVTSTIEDVAGNATREGSGRSTSYVYDFALPPGVSTFTVKHISDVNFVASADTRLEASAQPVTAGDAQTTLIVAAIVILGALFYMSKATGHPWMKLIRREEAAPPPPATRVEPQSPAAAARDA
jgi:hypothetical protein